MRSTDGASKEDRLSDIHGGLFAGSSSRKRGVGSQGARSGGIPDPLGHTRVLTEAAGDGKVERSGGRVGARRVWCRLGRRRRTCFSSGCAPVRECIYVYTMFVKILK